MEMPKPRNEFNFASMKVGESRNYTDEKYRAKTAAYQHGIYHGWKFTVRKQLDGSLTIWRIK